MTTPEDKKTEAAPSAPDQPVPEKPAPKKPAPKKPAAKKAPAPTAAKTDVTPKTAGATKTASTKPAPKKVASPAPAEPIPGNSTKAATPATAKPAAAKKPAQKTSQAQATPATAAKSAGTKTALIAPTIAPVAAPETEPVTPPAEPSPTTERANLQAEKILKRADKNPKSDDFIAKITLKGAAYWRLMRMDRPIGTLLLLWPTLWSLWLAAKGMPSVKNLVIFVLGVIVMRAAGCVINDFADRKIDGKVQRTKDRPLATGAVSSKEALGLFIALCLLAFVLVLFTDPFTIKLSVGGLVLAFCYPFMKRHTHLPQVVLGAAFAWGIPMAYAAEAGKLPQEVWLIYLAVVLWTVAYDTFYAMVDRDDDLKIGVKSTAILFGEQDRLMTGILQAMTIYALVLVGNRFELGTFYYLGLAAAAGLFIYQQWLIRFRARAACFQAFLNNNWVGVAVFAGIVMDYSFG